MRISFLSRFLRSASSDASTPPGQATGELPADDPLALFEAESDAPAASRPPAAPVATTPAPGPKAQEHVPAARAPAVSPAPPLTAIPSPTPGSLSLDTIVARRVPVLWPEAVAVVLAACDRLGPVDGAERQAPDLAGIRIHADGTVDASEGSSGDTSVARLARTLHALLPAQATPAPLRLLITKWIDTPHPHTIQTFAKELNYFARPDGDALVRALYDRCVAALQAPPPAVAAPPPVARDADAAIPQRPARTAPPRWLLPAAAALAAAAATGVWLTMAQGSILVEDTAAAMTVAAADAVPAGGENGSEVGTAGTLPPESRALPGAPRRLTDIELPATRRASAATSAAAASSTPARASTTPARTSPNPTLPAGAAVDSRLIPVPPLLPMPGQASATAAAPRTESTASGRVYSSVDAAVEPPQLVYPQLAPPPDNPGPNIAINTMEVVVGEDGRVQTAHLVTAPQRMTDMQLLSAAKVWRFEPAMLDGTPVRYRMRVSWATTP